MKCPFGLEYFTKFPQYCIMEFDNVVSLLLNVYPARDTVLNR